MLKNTLILIFSRKFFEKTFVIALFILLLWVLRDFLPLFLITFIFSYLFIEAGQFVHKKLRDWIRPAPKSITNKLLTPLVVITGLYIVFIVTVVFLFISVIPKIIMEIEKLLITLPGMLMGLQHMAIEFEQSIGVNIGAKDALASVVNEHTIQNF